MKTTDDIIQKGTELSATIQEARNTSRTKSQDLSLIFAQRITSLSRTIVLLTDAGAATEAHTICRLLFENIFNLGALLNDERHCDVLIKHSTGEPGRHINKIIEAHNKSAALTPENFQRAMKYMSNPDRDNDPKTGLNWEQIAASGKTDCFYVAYKQYSFLYAHSTLASILKEISEQEIAQLHENVWAVLEFARLLLRIKLLSAANQTKE